MPLLLIPPADAARLMRTASFLLAAASLGVLVILLAKGTYMQIVPVEGLLNPAIHFGVRPGAEPRLLESCLIAFFCTYIWSVVAWVQRSIASIALNVIFTPQGEATEIQTAHIQRLKQAIREADIGTVRALLNGGVRLPTEDGSGLTPLELAEIYDDSAIIELIETAQARGQIVDQRRRE